MLAPLLGGQRLAARVLRVGVGGGGGGGVRGQAARASDWGRHRGPGPTSRPPPGRAPARRSSRAQPRTTAPGSMRRTSSGTSHSGGSSPGRDTLSSWHAATMGFMKYLRRPGGGGVRAARAGTHTLPDTGAPASLRGAAHLGVPSDTTRAVLLKALAAVLSVSWRIHSGMSTSLCCSCPMHTDDAGSARLTRSCVCGGEGAALLCAMVAALATGTVVHTHRALRRPSHPSARPPASRRAQSASCPQRCRRACCAGRGCAPRRCRLPPGVQRAPRCVGEADACARLCPPLPAAPPPTARPPPPPPRARRSQTPSRRR